MRGTRHPTPCLRPAPVGVSVHTAPRGTGGARLLRQIEAMGVRATEQHWALIPPALAKRLRPRVGRVGDALLTSVATSDSLRMNRVIGLGSRGCATEAKIDEIVMDFVEDDAHWVHYTIG